MSEYLDTPLWVIVPAAGAGRRMASSLPKQYMLLAGQSMLQRTVSAVLDMPDVDGVIVALADDDDQWKSIPISVDPRVHSCIGGETRALSVVSGLRYLQGLMADNTWVLVHDAARPLVALSDVRRLLSAVYSSGSVGGLLATAVSDTLKKADDYNAVEQTVSRKDLWQAQTPQLFRSGQLLSALLSALSASEQSASESGSTNDNAVQTITDEASAMEMAGYTPLLVEALQPNLKVTRPADMKIAEALLALSGGNA